MIVESSTALPVAIVDRQLSRLAEGRVQFGDVIPFRRGIIFCHPDAVRDVLVSNDGKFGKPPQLRWARWTLGTGLLTADGELHRRQRPLVQPALHPKRLAGYAEVMLRHSVEAADRWSNGQAIDAHKQMTALTLHIVAEALFGAALGPEVDAISVAMDYNVRAFRRMRTRTGTVMAFLPTPFTIRYLLSRHKVLTVLKRFVSLRRSSGEQRDDLLGRLIAAKQPDGRPAMSEQQLIDECVTLFAAGHETTANAMTFTLWLLAHHPPVQAKLVEEIDAVLPDAAATLSIDDVDRLPYTRCVIAEAMRLFPPAWIQGRQALEEVTIHGTPVQRGQVVFVSQWLTHRDERWWPKPEEFDPDRFDVTDPQLATDGSPRPRWAYLPFGGGSRSCVGEAFAWAEMILVLATLARRWRFTPAPDAKPVHLEPGITLRSGTAVSLVVNKRK